MGNRAVIVFHNDRELSPCIYLHWSGEAVPRLLAAVRERMKGRDGDLHYTAARFVGICHDDIGGNTSLGMWNCRANGPKDETGLVEHSPGDAGVFLVRVQDWTVRRLCGSYGECRAPRQFTAGEVEFAADRFTPEETEGYEV